ncbi:HFL288Wp [Eremothecium sinecaudum]|uniref:ER membrane protein complex subunit 3 n=1 Tax=Eremothecium sinecaudum TaxID=45286 RepID=A0A109UZT9_9SACH|nr:HFL288Wp [Eremothecium sinecaudum]AMD21568.1 HFL288Wp [Eremothecium sinecaudum]
MSFLSQVGANSMLVELTLDPRLKFWVLLPISIVMLVVGVFRQQITQLIGNKVKTVSRAKVTENHYISKAQALLGNGLNLHEESFRVRQEYLANVLSEGKYLAMKDQSNDVQNILSDPNTMDTMVNMAVGNFANYIPQTLIMWWVNYFFGGFVLMKLPFPLTIRFKEMLQSGVLSSDLDVRWVSSISWYFISMFGLDPLYNLLFGNTEIDDFEISMQQQFVGSAMPGGPAPDVLMKNFANDLTIAQHESCFNGIEKRVLAMYS